MLASCILPAATIADSQDDGGSTSDAGVGKDGASDSGFVDSAAEDASDASAPVDSGSGPRCFTLQRVPGTIDSGLPCASTSASTSFDFSGPFTVEAWIYKRSSTDLTGPMPMVDIGPTEAELGYSLGLDATGHPQFIACHGQDAGGCFSVTSGSAAPADKWTHLAGEYDGISLTLFVDGILIQMVATESPAYLSSALVLHATDAIDDVRISTGYRYAASDFVPQTTLANDPATVILYHFDEAAGTTAAGVGDAAMPAALTSNASLGGSPSCN